MELKINSEIQYTSAAGVRKAKILDIKVGPTADPKRLNTWLTLFIPKQEGVKFEHTLQIPADNGSVQAFKIQTI